MSKIDENKRLACQWLEFVGEHNVEALCATTSPTWTMHGGPPNLPCGPEGVRALFGTFGPIEQTWTLEDVIAEGNKVVVRATNSCRQDQFMGIPTHGRWQVFSATFIHLIVDGLVCETWRNADDLGRMLQIGARLVPSSEARGA